LKRQPYVIEHLEKENDQGNVEYKLKFINPKDDKVKHRISQMIFRLNVNLFIMIINNLRKEMEKHFMC
jgi:hypothetical protein